MRFQFTLAIGLLSASISGATLAQDDPYDASIALGYVGTTGTPTQLHLMPKPC